MCKSRECIVCKAASYNFGENYDLSYMWPFNKKEESAPAPRLAKTILCIPGSWNSYEAFKDALIVTTDAKYMMAALVLMDVEGKTFFEVEFSDHDDDMRRAFYLAGLVNQLQEDFLDEIAQHKFVVFLSADTGNPEAAKNIAKAAAVILKAGGIGVKIESTGLAFDKEIWLGLVENYEEHHLYKLFVLDCIVDRDNDTVYTCGMHNLGLRDTIVQGEEPEDGIHLLRVFGYYQVVDKPIIQHDQTFRADMESPVYRILEEVEQPFYEDDPFYNPYGRWRLLRVEE